MANYPTSPANRNDEETLTQENGRLEAEVERLREGCEIWKQQSNITFQGLCERDRQLANKELEIQRLQVRLKWRESELQTAYERLHDCLAARRSQRGVPRREERDG